MGDSGWAADIVEVSMGCAGSGKTVRGWDPGYLLESMNIQNNAERSKLNTPTVVTHFGLQGRP